MYRKINFRFLTVIFIFHLTNLGFATLEEQSSPKHYFDKIINEVNSAGASWTAGHNFLTEIASNSSIKHLFGSMELDEEEENTFEKKIKCNHELVGHENHSKEFDGLESWKYCPFVNYIHNQGKCASDWALATVSAISDRICIFTKGKDKVILSPHEPLSCCKKCGWGCKKGYPQMVYKQWITKGLPTGGDYNSKKGCQPYEIKPCHGNIKKCFAHKTIETPKCKPYCYNSQYTQKYKDDLRKGAVAFRIGCPYCAAEEMKTNGPLTATLTVYEDFLTYKSGIYHHVSGKRLGRLTVKVVGFNDNGNPKYWVAVNSWGSKWGDKGIFKIQRGVNECMFENSLRGALVEDDDSDELI